MLLPAVTSEMHSRIAARGKRRKKNAHAIIGPSGVEILSGLSKRAAVLAKETSITEDQRPHVGGGASGPGAVTAANHPRMFTELAGQSRSGMPLASPGLKGEGS